MPNAPSEKKFLHALAKTGADCLCAGKLFSFFGSWERAWRAPASELEDAGLASERASAILAARRTLNPDEELRLLVKQGIALVERDETGYPADLATIPVPPAFLYIKGSIPSGPRLAIVGTRKATQYGREAVRKIVRELSQLHPGLAIVSGLAEGIDAEAHRSAIEHRLPTAGIIGSGMDRASFFPPANWDLAEEIVRRGGAVVSEYPPGSAARKHHFPARNRIIAGLAAGTLVAEAPEKSGALITANFALEAGRDVFAVPGPVFSPNARGAHLLIQQGAKLVASGNDIIEELGLEPRTPAEFLRPAGDAALTSALERTILELLREPLSVDELKSSLQSSTPEIMAALSMLELKGLIRPMGQNTFQKIL